MSELSLERTDILGLWMVSPKAVTDERGTIREFYRGSALPSAGVDVPPQWAQINLTWTRRGAVRGLHGESMTKLVGVAAGEAFGAYVDARTESATFGKVVTGRLVVGTQFLVPPGVCNGFQSVSDGGCHYLYCFDQEWRPAMSGVTVNPFDPDLRIPWPLDVDVTDPAQVSAKDREAPWFAIINRDAG